MNTEKPKKSYQQIIERPRNKKELAELLGVSVKILKKLIAPVELELGKPLGGIYSVKQVLFMVNKYGAAT